MTILADKLVERFPCGGGTIGYDADGVLWTLYDPAGGYRPILEAIADIKDPAQIAAAFDRAQRQELAEPFEQWGNVAGLIVSQDKVRAEFDPDESFEEEVSFAIFAPMLLAWQQAWEGARQRFPGAL